MHLACWGHRCGLIFVQEGLVSLSLAPLPLRELLCLLLDAGRMLGVPSIAGVGRRHACSRVVGLLRLPWCCVGVRLRVARPAVAAACRAS